MHFLYITEARDQSLFGTVVVHVDSCWHRCFFTLWSSLHPYKPTRLSYLIDGNVKFEPGIDLKRYIDSDGDEVSTVVRKGEKHGVCERSHIGNVMLERIGERQRLSFDFKSQRIEIGKGLTEPEREWLCEELRKYIGRYSI